MLRRLLLVALLLCLAGQVSAQREASEMPVLEDPVGDVEYLVAQEHAVPARGHEPVDLRTLSVRETLASIHFTVQVEGISSPVADQVVDAARLDIRFRHGEVRFDVGTGIDMDGQGFAELRRAEPGSVERLVGPLGFTMDGAGSFTVEVPRDALMDEEGAEPRRGRPLEGLHVDAHAHVTGVFLVQPDGSLFQPVGIRDRMPDSGYVLYDVRLGGPAVIGSVDLEVPEPFRGSNGAEGRFRFDTFLTNTGEARTFTLDAQAAPSGWRIHHARSVEVGAGERVAVPILVETPFGHQHGGRESFEMHYRADGAHARATMGIHYLEIAQPAGHHDTVWVHSADDGFGARAWMNTLEQDDDAEQTPVRGTSGPIADAGFTWTLCLQPQLRLGIDMAMERTGTLDASFEAPRDMAGTLSGSLVRFPLPTSRECLPGDDRTVLASIGPVDATLSQPAAGVPVTPAETGDLVPYERNHGLALILVFEPTDAATSFDAPSLLPGARMRLPLNEYMDQDADFDPPSTGGRTGGPGQAPEDNGAPGLPVSLGLLLLALGAVARRPGPGN